MRDSVSAPSGVVNGVVGHINLFNGLSKVWIGACEKGLVVATLDRIIRHVYEDDGVNLFDFQKGNLVELTDTPPIGGCRQARGNP